MAVQSPILTARERLGDVPDAVAAYVERCADEIATTTAMAAGMLALLAELKKHVEHQPAQLRIVMQCARLAGAVGDQLESVEADLRIVE